jgi:hypothetical protein
VKSISSLPFIGVDTPELDAYMYKEKLKKDNPNINPYGVMNEFMRQPIDNFVTLPMAERRKNQSVNDFIDYDKATGEAFFKESVDSSVKKFLSSALSQVSIIGESIKNLEESKKPEENRTDKEWADIQKEVKTLNINAKNVNFSNIDSDMANKYN